MSQDNKTPANDLEVLMLQLQDALQAKQKQEVDVEEAAAVEALGGASKSEFEEMIDEINRRRQKFAAAEQEKLQGEEKSALLPEQENKNPMARVLAELNRRTKARTLNPLSPWVRLEAFEKEKDVLTPEELEQKEHDFRAAFESVKAGINEDKEVFIKRVFIDKNKKSAAALFDDLLSIEKSFSYDQIEAKKHVLEKHLVSAELSGEDVLIKRVGRAVRAACTASVEATLEDLRNITTPTSSEELEKLALRVEELCDKGDVENTTLIKATTLKAMRGAYGRLALVRLNELDSSEVRLEAERVEFLVNEIQSYLNKGETLLKIQTQDSLQETRTALHLRLAEARLVQFENCVDVQDAGAIAEQVEAIIKHYKVIDRSMKEEDLLRLDVGAQRAHTLAVDGKIALLLSSKKAYSHKTIRRLRREIIEHIKPSAYSMNKFMKKRIKEAVRDAHGFSAYAKIDRLAETKHAYSPSALLRAEGEIRKHFARSKITMDEKDSESLAQALMHAREVAAKAKELRLERTSKKSPEERRIEEINRMTRHEICRRKLSSADESAVRAAMSELYDRRATNLAEKKQALLLQQEYEDETAKARAAKGQNTRLLKTAALRDLEKSRQAFLSDIQTLSGAEKEEAMQRQSEVFKAERKKILGRASRGKTATRVNKIMGRSHAEECTL